jgi:hypothetical protein
VYSFAPLQGQTDGQVFQTGTTDGALAGVVTHRYNPN